jgi:hypothetical protein
MGENPVRETSPAFGWLLPVRDRRELSISTVTPVVATVVVATAMVAVGVRNLGGSPPAAAPQPTGVLGSDNRFVIAILTTQPVTVDAATGRANTNKVSTVILHALTPAVS